MIVNASVCVCFVCGHRWLPITRARAIKRCASCKTRKWNDDDPRALAAKRHPREVTEASKTQTIANTRQRHARALVRKKADSKPVTRPRAVVLCKHRVIASQCPLCPKRKP